MGENAVNEVKYMNVWRNEDGTSQWTDGYGVGAGPRDFCDRVAASVERKNVGIRRMGLLRVRLKGQPHD